MYLTGWQLVYKKRHPRRDAFVVIAKCFGQSDRSDTLAEQPGFNPLMPYRRLTEEDQDDRTEQHQ